MRLFVGLGLDEPVRGAAAGVSQRLERRISAVAGDFKASWVPPANLHITVWFFGEVADAPAADLVRDLASPLEIPSFELAVRGCGAFPHAGAPRVLWIGTADGNREMAAVYAALAARLAPLGYAPEPRAFSPHLTLARVKHPGRAARPVREVLTEEQADCGRMPVTALTLFRSRLSSRGAVYEPLQRVPLS